MLYIINSFTAPHEGERDDGREDERGQQCIIVKFTMANNWEYYYRVLEPGLNNTCGLRQENRLVWKTPVDSVIFRVRTKTDENLTSGILTCYNARVYLNTHTHTAWNGSEWSEPITEN